MSNSLDFLSTVWSSLLRVMLDAQRYDADHDGLIENGGVPDQSYDMWNATGPSAYTGMMKKRDFFFLFPNPNPYCTYVGLLYTPHLLTREAQGGCGWEH